MKALYGRNKIEIMDGYEVAVDAELDIYDATDADDYDHQGCKYADLYVDGQCYGSVLVAEGEDLDEAVDNLIFDFCFTYMNHGIWSWK